MRINKLLADNRFAQALDPEKSLTPPKSPKRVPHFNFAPLINALDELNRVAATLDKQLAAGEYRSKQIEAINRQLLLSERQLTLKAGLPGRPWYKHQIYAPGFYTGYGVKTLPRIRESIEVEHYAQVDSEIETTAKVVASFTAHLSQLVELL